MKKNLLLTALLLLLTTVSYAQVNFSVKGGLCFANYIDENSNSADAKSGLVFGVNMDIPLQNSNFSFSPSLLFISKGADMTMNTSLTLSDGTGISTMSKMTATQNYLEIPITMKYRLPISSKLNLTMALGPYLACGISGKTKISTSYSGVAISREMNSFGKEVGIHRLDYGIIYGVGIEYDKLIFSIDYDHGLPSIHDHYNGQSWIKNESIALTLGYKL